MPECYLRRHLEMSGEACDEGACIFWRVIEVDGADDQPHCAIEYFNLLEGRGPELAEWLLRLRGRADLADALLAECAEGRCDARSEF